MTMVAHRRSRAMVSTHSRTTPAATSRAETSLTGFGNEKRARTRPGPPDVMSLAPPMPCSFRIVLTLTRLVGYCQGTTGRRGMVVGLVDAVTEAHDPVPPLAGGPDVGVGPVRGADRIEHVEGPARGPAVQRPRQRADGRHDGGPEVGAGRRHDAGGEGRRV